MDLDKYINDNLDEILNNSEDFIGLKSKNEQKPKKRVTWKEEIEETSKIIDTMNED